MAGWGQRIAALFFPRTCVLCQMVMEPDAWVCPNCQVPYIHGPLRLAPDISWSMDEVVAPLHYEGLVSEAVLRLKEYRDRGLVEFFAQHMADVVKSWLHEAELDILIEVPQSSAKEKQVGFNPTALLAQALSRKTDIPWVTGCLVRSNTSLTQHHLGLPERFVNARESYSFCKGMEHAVANKVCLLVDDVFTTGATMEVCAGCLLEAGAKQVYGVAATSPQIETSIKE